MLRPDVPVKYVVDARDLGINGQVWPRQPDFKGWVCKV